MKLYEGVKWLGTTNYKGIPVPEKTCGHKHRSMKAAHKCSKKLNFSWTEQRIRNIETGEILLMIFTEE